MSSSLISPSVRDDRAFDVRRTAEGACVTFRLTDGTMALLRPIVPDDRKLLERGFDLLSSHSRYLRFFSCAPVLLEDQWRYFTEVDQINHVAWVATGSGPLATSALGAARFVRMPDQPTIAEAAFVVVDAVQNRGVGTALLAMLCLMARERNVRVLRSVCLAENRRVVSWLCRLGAQMRFAPAGSVELDLHVDRQPGLETMRATVLKFAQVLDHLAETLKETRR